MHDSLLQDLSLTADNSKPLDSLYKTAVQRIRYKWTKPQEEEAGQPSSEPVKEAD